MYETRKGNFVVILTGVLIITLLGVGILGFLKMDADNVHSHDLVTIESLNQQIEGLNSEVNRLQEALATAQNENIELVSTNEANMMYITKIESTIDMVLLELEELEQMYIEQVNINNGWDMILDNVE